MKPFHEQSPGSYLEGLTFIEPRLKAVMTIFYRLPKEYFENTRRRGEKRAAQIMRRSMVLSEAVIKSWKKKPKYSVPDFLGQPLSNRIKLNIQNSVSSLVTLLTVSISIGLYFYFHKKYDYHVLKYLWHDRIHSWLWVLSSRLVWQIVDYKIIAFA